MNRLWPLLALALVTGAACSGGPGGPDAGPNRQDGGDIPDPDPDDAGPPPDAGAPDAGPPPSAEELAAQMCRAAFVGAQNIALHLSDPGRCAAAEAIPDGANEPGLVDEPFLECLPGQPRYEEYLAALQGERVSIDADRLLACAEAGRVARAARATWGAWSERESELEALLADPRCAGAVVSLLDEGDPCVHAWDCPAGTACEPEPLDGQDLFCLPPAAQGQTCAYNADGSLLRTCAAGTACYNGLCVFRRPAGQACGPGEVPCAEGLVCGPAGVCAAPSPVDGLCGSDEHCEAGAFCRLGLCALPLVDGAACESADRCQGTCSVCRPQSPGGETQCLDRGAGGAACTTLNHCREGFFCEVTDVDGGTSSACAPEGVVGTPCGPGVPCRAGLTCSLPIPDPPVVGPDGGLIDPDPDMLPPDGGTPEGPTCRVPPVVGSFCAQGAIPCAVGACVGGLCVAGLAGDPCGADGDCLEGNLCVGGTCTLAPRDGAPCTADLRCAAGLYCDGERCLGYPGPGEPCAPGGLCNDDAWCNGGVSCLARRPSGEPCSFDGQCASDLCLITQTCAARGPSCWSQDEGFTLLLLFSVAVPVGVLRRRRRSR